MKHEFYIISDYDGLSISGMLSEPEEKTVGVLILVHGICGKKERFSPTIEYMTGQGIACIAYDQRGHGKSIREEKDRGYIYNGGWEAMVTDLKNIVEWTRAHFPEEPLVILGHSMGSMVARAYIKSHAADIDGIIACGSPGYRRLSVIGKAIMKSACSIGDGRWRPRRMIRQTSEMFNRKFRKEGKMAWTCSDANIRKAFSEDPECNFDITADCSLAVMELMEQTYSMKGWHEANLSIPIIFLSGEDDPCMISTDKLQRTVRLMKQAGFSLVSSRTYPGMRHEILLETGKATVWKDILQFLMNLVEQKSI